MRNFDYSKLTNMKWNCKIVGYISQIRLMQGKQETLAANGDELKRLIYLAKIESTQASNAIEGIRTTDTRLKQLISNKIAPKSRNEEEIAGYRDVLNLIHENYEYIPLTPNYILQLHQILYSHGSSSIGGKFKSVQNYISAIDESGRAVTLFTPLAPSETPIAIEKICTSFNREIACGEIDPLILIAVFIHDFLCIHPFLDGNGRMSRLITTLLLYQSGFNIAKYISLERKIEKQKNEYYDALAAAQNGWNEDSEDVSPFVEYILMIIFSAYRDLQQRIDIISDGSSAAEVVRRATEKIVGKFTKFDIMSLCPTMSKSSIEKALKQLSSSGAIIKRGKGRSTFYTRNQ